jgi:hypothetical protein
MTSGSIARSIILLSTAVAVAVFPAHVTLAKSTGLRGHHINKVSPSSGSSGSHLTSAPPNTPAEPNNHSSAKFGVVPSAQEPEAHSANTRVGPNSAGANERAGQQTDKTESRGGPKNGDVKVPSNTETSGKTPNSVESRARDVNAIDAGNFAPSHRQKGKSEDIRKSKMPIKLSTTRNLPTRRKTIPGPVHGVARNAVGIPNTQSSAAKPDVGKSVLPNVAATPAGNERSAPIPPDGVVPHSIVAQPNPVSAIPPIASSRGVINGTALVRIGSGPAAIGGPARVVAGLNGTAIRLKH